MGYHTNPGELHPCSLVGVGLGECFRSDQVRRVPELAWDWPYRDLGGVVLPPVGADTVVDMMVAAEEHHPMGVLGYPEGVMVYGCWPSDCCCRNRSGPDEY